MNNRSAGPCEEKGTNSRWGLHETRASADRFAGVKPERYELRRVVPGDGLSTTLPALRRADGIPIRLPASVVQVSRDKE